MNHAHPGYPYPEAAGLWLRFAAWHGVSEALVAPVRARLRADCGEGMAGRAGLSYAFDTAVALGGLAATGEVGAVEQRMFDALLVAIDQRRAVREDTPADRWSTRWTGHQLKSIAPLRRYASSTGDGRAREAADRLLRDLRGADPLDGGDFYTHAFCYAAEGLLAAQAWGLGDFARDLDAHAATLASLQREDGALPAFRSGGPARADATAQAVRLWAAIDRARHAGAIARALDALAALDAGDGGLRYEPGSGDVNTWATVFAAQAEAWAGGEVDAGELW